MKDEKLYQLVFACYMDLETIQFVIQIPKLNGKYILK